MDPTPLPLRALRARPPARAREDYVACSTLGELAAERAAVARAISALGLTPVMFELGARPHPPRELYRAHAPCRGDNGLLTDEYPPSRPPAGTRPRPGTRSLGAHYHRIRTHQVVHARFTESDHFHPSGTVSARVIETCRSLDEHVQAH
jgi:hypothetical protein